MALADIQKVRLEVGLSGEAASVLTDDEIQYFLDKYNNNIKKSSLDVAKTVLFIVSSIVHERSGTELEIWGHTWFENYMAALKLYLSNPNFSISIGSIQAYAGGISVEDVRRNIDNQDNVVVNVDVGIPTDHGVPTHLNTNSGLFHAEQYEV